MEILRRLWLARNGRSFLMKAGLTACASLWAANGVPPARSDVAMLMQTLNVQLDAVGKVSAPASVNLIPTGTVFSPYGGSLTLLYRVRSTPDSASLPATLAPSSSTPRTGSSRKSNCRIPSCCSAT